MVKIDEAVIARYNTEGEHFEVLVDPDLAMDLKSGKEVNFDALLAIDRVFKDSKKGEEKSPQALEKVFGTTDVAKIAKRIIVEGEVQLTTEQRRRFLENRRKEIVALVAKNALNPQTNAPHPPARIEKAMEEAKIHVDLMKSSHEQMKIVIEQIRTLIPISMEKLRIAVKVPASYSGKCSAILHRYEMQKEEWQNDGSLVALLELPAGLKVELMNELNKATHGDIEVKVL